MPDTARIDSIAAAPTAKRVTDETSVVFPVPWARRSQQNATKNTTNVSEDLDMI